MMEIYRERAKPKLSRKFTWKELSKLSSRHNAHVAVRGKVHTSRCAHACGDITPRACFHTLVYDVSSFVGRHPGGVDQIMLGTGRDVTQLFESYHSAEAY